MACVRETIVQNSDLSQLLAGARINELTSQKKTCLHLASEHDQSVICQILIENGINFDTLDDSLNNGELMTRSIYIVVYLIGCIVGKI